MAKKKWDVKSHDEWEFGNQTHHISHVVRSDGPVLDLRKVYFASNMWRGTRNGVCIEPQYVEELVAALKTLEQEDTEAVSLSSGQFAMRDFYHTKRYLFIGQIMPNGYKKGYTIPFQLLGLLIDAIPLFWEARNE